MFGRFLIAAPLGMLVTLAVFFLLKGVLYPQRQTLTEEMAESIGNSRKAREDESKPTDWDQEASTKKQEAFDYYIPDSPTRSVVRLPPAYPGSCGEVRGKVVAEFYVEADGRIRDVTVVRSTSSCFANAAKRAVLKWRYRPRVENGEPVRSRRQRVVVEFQPE